LHEKVLSRLLLNIAWVITKAHQFIPIQQISPHILGGLIVEIGDRTIDYSVSSKITKLNKMLTDMV